MNEPTAGETRDTLKAVVSAAAWLIIANILLSALTKLLVMTTDEAAAGTPQRPTTSFAVTGPGVTGPALATP